MRRRLALLMLVAGVILIAQARADALSIKLIQGATTVVCNDGDLCDLAPQTGIVVFFGAVGTYNLNVTTSLSYPFVGSPDQPILDLNSINSTAIGGPLELFASQTGFTRTPVNLHLAAGGTLSNITNVASEAYYSNTNALFATTTLIDSFGPFGPPGYFATSDPSIAPAAPYSLTLRQVFSSPGNGFYSGDFELSSAVPEPASALFFGLGLVSLVGFGARRRPLGNA